MLSQKIENALNEQILLEAESSQFYLSMASWAENSGFSGTAEFFYRHSNEERGHMMKLIRYVNERTGKAVIPALQKPQESYDSLLDAFEKLLSHEQMVTESINELVFLSLEVKDYTTHNFLQWYVAEQLEEEALARTALDRLKIVGEDKSGVYMFDRDIQSLQVKSAAQEGGL